MIFFLLKKILWNRHEMKKAKFHMRYPVLLHGVHAIPFDIYEIERYSTMMWILKVEIESRKTHFYPQIK